MTSALIEKVYAAVSVTNVVDPLKGWTSMGTIFSFIINVIIGIGWGLVFVMLALGFVQYILSKGEKTATQNAQQWLTYAVIGGVGLFATMVFRRLIVGMLGISNEIDGGLGDLTKF